MENSKRIVDIVSWYIDLCEQGNKPTKNETARRLTALNLSENDKKWAIKKLNDEWLLIEDARAKIKSAKSGVIISFLLVIPSLFFSYHLQEVASEELRWQAVFFIGGIISFFSGINGLVTIRKMKSLIATRDSTWPGILNENPCLKGQRIEAIYQPSEFIEFPILKTEKGYFELSNESLICLNGLQFEMEPVDLPLNGANIVDIKIYFNMYAIELSDGAGLFYSSVFVEEQGWSNPHFHLQSPIEFDKTMQEWTNFQHISLCDFEEVED